MNIRREKTGTESTLNGYLTVYAALTLTVMISLCLVLIEDVRRNTIALETECVMDIGMDSVLAEYHRELLRRYGLFMVDTSYGTDYPSYYNMEQHLYDYLSRNLSYEDCHQLSFLYHDLLGIKLEDVQVVKVSLTTDNNGRSFQHRAAEHMRSRLGLDVAGELLEWIETAEGYGLLEQNVEEQLDDAAAQLLRYDGMERQIGEEEWVKISVPDPTRPVQQMRREGILKWVVEDTSQLSAVTIDPQQYISRRAARGEVNHGSSWEQEELQLLDNILLLEYFLTYAGRYGKQMEDSLLQYQVEYLLFGNACDRENLRQAASAICGIREAANVVYLMGNAEKKGEAEVLATILSGIIALPELEPLFETALILTWAYLESLYDVRTLLMGGRVELLKTDESWHYSLSNIWSPSMEGTSTASAGLSYEDYLRLMLYLQSPDVLTMRFMDLMEMDIRRTPGNEYFRMDGCIDGLEAEAAISSGYGYAFTIRREKEY
ncbi:MAG: DUF5702 domain-containing protein [bacterium]|nr:DUF5702 domain-containing protein [bacterium]MCM1374695.1 DUF5702 domain-containing protein [Muribaculum sp.]